jgi:hypothetical protein
MLRIGTPYFITKQAAIKYYTPYGYFDPKAAVERKLKDKEIYIGEPPLKPNQRAVLDRTEGRYIIEEEK